MKCKINNDEMIIKGIDEIPMFSWNTQTKEFYVLGHKFDGVNSIEDFINYIYNLDKENKQLKEEQLYNYITDDEYIKNIECKYLRSEEKNKLYKSVLDEIREYINNNKDTCYTDDDINYILNTIDKVKE